MFPIEPDHTLAIPLQYEVGATKLDCRMGSRQAKVNTLKIINPSIALQELIAEVDHATPKQVVFFDSTPLVGGPTPHAVNWADTYSHPHMITIFLNPARASAEIVAHELMHAWIEYYCGFEDQRSYFDPNDHGMSFMVDCIQSAILDCKILWELQKRGGFRLERFYQDALASAHNNIQPLGERMVHPNAYHALIAANQLAVPTAFPDLYHVGPEGRSMLDQLWKVCRRAAPDIADTAQRMADAMASFQLDDLASGRTAITWCLDVAFNYLGLRFDPNKHLTIRHPLMDIEADKMPNFMHGAPPMLKHTLIRNSVLTKRHIAWGLVENGKHKVAMVDAGPDYSALSLPPIVAPKLDFKGLDSILHEPDNLSRDLDYYPRLTKAIDCLEYQRQVETFYEPKFVFRSSPGELTNTA